MRNPKIIEAIQTREQNRLDIGIATRQERQIFWKKIMNDAVLPMKDRLAASKLLGQSEGDFIQRHDHGVNADIDFNDELPEAIRQLLEDTIG